MDQLGPHSGSAGSELGAIPKLSEQVFEKYDKDHSGAVDTKELQDMVMNMGYHLSDEELSIAILHLDTSGDGKIGHGPYKSFRHPAVHALSSFAVLAIQNIRK